MPNDTPDWYLVAAQGQTLLGTITTPGDGLAHSQTFALPSPATTQAVAIRARTTGGFFLPSDARIVGDVTGSVYVLLQSANANAGSQVERWYLPDAKAVCTVTDQGASKPASIDFIALNFGPVTTVRTDPNGPALAVVLSNPNASPPPAFSANVAFTFAPGTPTVVVVPATAGQTVFLRKVSLTWDSAVSNTIEHRDTSGTAYGSIDPANSSPYYFDFEGFALPVGLGYQLTLNGGAGITCRGTVTYT